ncbi:hypothetical protein Tco_0390497 [Tanacetum coccineum]
MTSDHNSSELGIHDHSNELSSSKLVPKVVPLADKTATPRQGWNSIPHILTMWRCTLKVFTMTNGNPSQCHLQKALQMTHSENSNYLNSLLRVVALRECRMRSSKHGTSNTCVRDPIRFELKPVKEVL